MRLRAFTLVAFATAFVATTATAADSAADVVRIHIEAIGGLARIQSLKVFRATGRVLTSGAPIRFTMIAARPNRLRMELHYDARTLVQATDGIGPAWELDTEKKNPAATLMSVADAQSFMADAQFDDPLVAAEALGHQLIFGGPVTVDGHKLLKFQVTRKPADTFYVLLDPETYFIVLRVDQTPTDRGLKATVVTRYDDFRPVAGVLVAHEVKVHVDGKLTQHAKIDSIEPNPRLPTTIFTRPTGSRGTVKP